MVSHDSPPFSLIHKLPVVLPKMSELERNGHLAVVAAPAALVPVQEPVPQPQPPGPLPRSTTY